MGFRNAINFCVFQQFPTWPRRSWRSTASQGGCRWCSGTLCFGNTITINDSKRKINSGSQVVAVNGVAERVSVVQRDAGLLERGKHVRRLGVNVVTADFFDAGSRRHANQQHLTVLRVS